MNSKVIVVQARRMELATVAPFVPLFGTFEKRQGKVGMDVYVLWQLWLVWLSRSLGTLPPPGWVNVRHKHGMPAREIISKMSNRCSEVSSWSRHLMLWCAAHS